MVAVMPEGTPTLGNIKVQVAVAVADLAAPKLATEINAAGSVDISCYLQPGGWNPDGTTQKGTKPLRLCSKRSQEQINRTTFMLADLMYVYDPQAADAAANNEAKEILVAGTEVFLIERLGLDAEDVDWATTQRVRTHWVRLAEAIPVGDPTDENAEFVLKQALVYVNDGPVDGVIAA